MSYSQIKMCMCIEYLVANLILLCSLKYISLLWNIFYENMGYLFSSFSFSPFLFIYFGLLLYPSFIYFCITHVSFHNKPLREILSKTWIIYFDNPNKYFFCLLLVQQQNILGWTKSIFLRISSVEAAHICGVYMILILGT